MSHSSKPVAAAVGSLLLLTLTSASVDAAPRGGLGLPRGAVDISTTARGAKLIDEAALRFSAKGIKPRQLRAITDATGILIASVGTKFTTYSTTLADGRTVQALAPMTPDAPPTTSSPASGGITMLASGTWSLQASDCFARISDTWSVLDHCYQMWKETSDANPTYDWFALNHYGTARNNEPWAVGLAKIRAYKIGSSAQTWADWSPRSDWSGGSCSNVQVAIVSPVGGIAVGFDRCPQAVTFTKSANGTSPDYTQQWFGPGTHGNREVNFEISVRVAQGAWAQWALPAEVHGGPV